VGVVQGHEDHLQRLLLLAHQLLYSTEHGICNGWLEMKTFQKGLLKWCTQRVRLLQNVNNTCCVDNVNVIKNFKPFPCILRICH
jgi:hypothetical protein